MNLTQTREVTTEIIKEAGELLKKYFRTGSFTSHSKGGTDFATQADDEIDLFLREKLQKAFPKTKFLTEENAPKDFTSFKDENDVWIIDPIDGTTNFSRDDNHFAISVGLVDKGTTKLGIVYLPTEEDGKLYFAQEDKDGAYCNTTSIHVSERTDLQTISVGFDWSWENEDRKKTLRWLETIVDKIRQPRSLGSASADLCLVAEGRLDGYVNWGLKPWDVAGAVIILQKAGGKITTTTGIPWTVFDPDIVATNGKLHDILLPFLKT